MLFCSSFFGVVLPCTDRGESPPTLGEGSVYIQTARCLCLAVGPGQEDGSLSGGTRLKAKAAQGL